MQVQIGRVIQEVLGVGCQYFGTRQWDGDRRARLAPRGATADELPNGVHPEGVLVRS